MKVLTSTPHSHAVNKLNFQPLYHFFAVVAVPSLSPVWLFVTPWTAAHQSSLSFIISQFAQIHVHWVSDAIQPSHPRSPPYPAFSLSQHQGLFQWVSSSIRWPKYWSFSIHPSNEYSGLISFRIDWFDLLAVHGTLKSLLEHHSSKASFLYALGNADLPFVPISSKLPSFLGTWHI